MPESDIARLFDHLVGTRGGIYTQQFKMFTDAIRWSLSVELQPGDRADIFLEGNLVWTKHLHEER